MYGRSSRNCIDQLHIFQLPLPISEDTVPVAVFEMLKAIPIIGALPGDLLIFRPTHERSFVLQRILNPMYVDVLSDLTLSRLLDLSHSSDRPPAWASELLDRLRPDHHEDHGLYLLE